MSQDLFDNVVEESTDRNLSLDLTSSPCFSSGVSGADSEAARLSQTEEPAAISRTYKCQELLCSKVYKTQQGLQKHLFLHKINDLNVRKPEAEDLVPYIDELVLKILNEINSEFEGDEVQKLARELIRQSESNLNWHHFVTALADPLLHALTEKSKVLPVNQYEEQLICLNRALNNKENFETLKNQLLMVSSDNTFAQSFAPGMILFRLCTRLLDEVQLLVLQMMKNDFDEGCSESAGNFDLEEGEKEAFDWHMKQIIKAFFRRGEKIGSNMWLTRCKCICKNFVCIGYEPVPMAVFADRDFWDENKDTPSKIVLTEKALVFFNSVEKLIKQCISEQSSADTVQAVMDKLSLVGNRNILDSWFWLTTPYLSEGDSLIFMRGMVSALTKLSIRLENDRLRSVKQTQQRAQKFALRTSLQRN